MPRTTEMNHDGNSGVERDNRRRGNPGPLARMLVIIALGSVWIIATSAALLFSSLVLSEYLALHVWLHEFGLAAFGWLVIVAFLFGGED